MARYFTKLFQETRYYTRTPGGGPEDWKLLSRSPSIEAQVRHWVEAGGVEIVSASPPNFSHYWIDDAYTRKCIMVGITVIYQQIEEPLNVPEPVLLTAGE